MNPHKPMNILYIDIDSLRPDHLGCYGYPRKTSPHIDAIAAEGLRFTNCYVPDAPCLPSRTAMTTGKFGIHTGVVNHGGVASQPHIWGRERGFRCNMTESNWANQFQRAGYHTVAFSPFAQRHGAWHWYAGFMEIHNTGGGGMEVASDIDPQVCDWLERAAAKGGSGSAATKPFFMWVNVWDPHTPYRTPPGNDNPFKDDPLPEWYTEAVRADHWQKAGPHSPQEVPDFVPEPDFIFNNPGLRERFPTIDALQPKQIDSMAEARRMFDGYDMGVHYADQAVGRIIARLKALGLYENTAIIVSADHGENLGELWVYGDHQTADKVTHNVPLIVRWPGITDNHAGAADERLLYSLDMGATTLELAGLEVPADWDGQSFAGEFVAGKSRHARDHLVLSQLAWCAQRSARWDRYICIETYHDGFHDYPRHMVFDLAADPHEQHDLAPERPDLVDRGKALLHDWRAATRETATHKSDPLDTVMSEGGPFHVRGQGPAYIERLKQTGRAEIARRFEGRAAPFNDRSAKTP
jgi:arylsulfatase A-like enzyme